MNPNFVAEVLPYDYSELVFQQSPLQKLWEAISALKILFYMDETGINDPFIVHQRITDQGGNTIDRIYLSLIEPDGIADSPMGLRNLIRDVERDETTAPNLRIWCANYLNQPQPSFDLIMVFLQTVVDDNFEQNFPVYSLGLGWMNPISNTPVGFRTYDPHNHDNAVAVSDEIKRIKSLRDRHPRFFTAITLLTCDNYAVPLHPLHGLNIELLDYVTQNNIFLKITVVFDLLMMIKILSCHQYALSIPFSLHDILHLNTQNLPTIQIRNPAIIIQGGNIQENINCIFRICNFSFPDLQQNLFQPLLEAWHCHHNLNRLLLEFEVYWTICKHTTVNIQNLSFQYLLKNQSIQRYLILRTLQQINFEQTVPRLRLMFTNATDLSFQDGQLSFTIEHIDGLGNNNNIKIIRDHLNNDRLIDLYIIDLLTAFSCLHKAGISFSGNLSLFRTLRVVEGEIQFHLQVDVEVDEARFTQSPPLNNLRLLSNYFKELRNSFHFSNRFSTLLIQHVDQLSNRLMDGNFFDLYQFNYAAAWGNIREQQP